MDRRTPRPTDKELEILWVLWQCGPSTVRGVLKALNHERSVPVGYTTALKMLQIMTEKGLVDRDETRRPQVYWAHLAQEQTQRQLVEDLLDRAFSGSAQQLVMQALGAAEVSDEDLARVERLLDRIERARK